MKIVENLMKILYVLKKTHSSVINFTHTGASKGAKKANQGIFVCRLVRRTLIYQGAGNWVDLFFLWRVRNVNSVQHQFEGKQPKCSIYQGTVNDCLSFTYYEPLTESLLSNRIIGFF